MILNEEEQNCIRFLAKCFSDNKVFIQRDWAIEQMRVDVNKYVTLIRTMEGLGAVYNVSNTSKGHASSFEISPKVLQLARQLDVEEQKAKAPPDVVEQLQARARQNPCLARLIIIFLILALLIPLLNSLWELLEKIATLSSGK